MHLPRARTKVQVHVLVECACVARAVGAVDTGNVCRSRCARRASAARTQRMAVEPLSICPKPLHLVLPGPVPRSWAA